MFVRLFLSFCPPVCPSFCPFGGAYGAACLLANVPSARQMIPLHVAKSSTTYAPCAVSLLHADSSTAKPYMACILYHICTIPGTAGRTSLRQLRGSRRPTENEAMSCNPGRYMLLSG